MVPKANLEFCRVDVDIDLGRRDPKIKEETWSVSGVDRRPIPRLRGPDEEGIAKRTTVDQ
jgi:hypothetical protein